MGTIIEWGLNARQAGLTLSVWGLLWRVWSLDQHSRFNDLNDLQIE
jgi:hypothetical protein